MIHLAYGDVSGDSAPVLTAGCYLGKEGEWMDAIASWCRALDDAEVKEFHATDFFSAQNEFDDDKWRHFVPGKGMVVGGELHNTFAARFTSIPVDNGLIGFAFSLDVPAFNEILAPELAKVHRVQSEAHPRTHVIMSSLAAIGAFLEKATYREKERIQAIFEHEAGAGRFMDFFDESKKRNERWTWWFKSFTTAPKSFVPLQMGDLLAHEAWRRTKEVWSPKPRAIRKSFERMLSDGSIQLNAHDRNHCIKNAVAVRNLLARYPNGLAPAEELLPANG